MNGYTENRRRTVVKSLLWRFIGIFWTWGGAYVIILALPDSQKNALTIATLVTAWHHSTRLLMYYGYERLWAKVSWGKFDESCGQLPPLALKQKINWSVMTFACVAIVFWLLFSVTPQIKNDQKRAITEQVSRVSEK
ncbi:MULTISPECIES: DUF2061 domain-containing protein [unclassified Lentimonas]|uniref:DUF2061 domain-containing protein n=1 Tax=unclassified Lentimonas TaxID=2630993 RepID=UPI00132BE469|nr:MULTISPECIES: DUF2061 domain-containing protein [unclassified Lentimonas]CAA6692148.1 Unannotated [Lentimonas sp. CC19]CAA6694452.1 Unannotated [Lentimonas sp. CC10]CAA7070599.1 Unannotated [Lentimonas sp. CC11]